MTDHDAGGLQSDILATSAGWHTWAYAAVTNVDVEFSAKN